MVGFVHYVAGNQQRGSAAGEFDELFPQIHAQHGIQAHCGFVEHQQRGLADQRAGQRRPGALSTGKVAAVRGSVICQADAFNGVIGGPAVVAVQRREVPHVVDDAQVVVDGWVLDVYKRQLQGNHPVRLFIGSGMPTGLWDRVCDAFTPAHVVEFFATTDGQAVLANVSGVKVGSEGRPLPGAGRVELGAYDAENDLILENERGFVQLADVNQVGVLLAQSRGPIDPTASVKRGVFSAGDTWISTEYLFRRDEDGDYWLMGRRGSVVVTARGLVYPEAVTDALGFINGVDLAASYNVPVGDREVAVSAVTLLPGASITAADLTEAVAKMPVGLGPDIVHVVPEMALSASYRPTVSALRAAGIPKPGRQRQAWYFDPGDSAFRKLTAGARSALSGEQRRSDG